MKQKLQTVISDISLRRKQNSAAILINEWEEITHVSYPTLKKLPRDDSLDVTSNSSIIDFFRCSCGSELSFTAIGHNRMVSCLSLMVQLPAQSERDAK